MDYNSLKENYERLNNEIKKLNLETKKENENLKKENKNFKNENEKIKNDNKELTLENNFLKENYGKLKNENIILNLNNNNDDKNKDLLKNVKDKKSSEIFLTEELENKIKNFLPDKYKNYYPIKFQLLYKASEDGNVKSNFHKKVDGKGPLIIIVQTEFGRNYIFFTSKTWNNNGKLVEDTEAFYFLNTKYKYNNNIKKIYGCIHSKNNELIFVYNYSNQYKKYDQIIINCEDKIINSKIIDYEVYFLSY